MFSEWWDQTPPIRLVGLLPSFREFGKPIRNLILSYSSTDIPSLQTVSFSSEHINPSRSLFGSKHRTWSKQTRFPNTSKQS
ncbi:hypothetical protein CEXT_271971 [Caerostris extrusa]|uniref:Uncharacterized protein n=1 Tax=Caerostris extrusa TaxID=172846 RepID=A0AAV4NQU9_CAEEX|nr:hypothetical protein CEXT_271971 [Caerostris extrusa]